MVNPQEKQAKAVLRSAPYITDNPYRLLGVGSSMLQTELRRKANNVKQRLNAGLDVESSLHDFFGSEDLIRCADIVKSLSSDVHKQITYKLLWPFMYSNSIFSDSPIPEMSIFILPDIDEKNFIYTQHCFLNAWYYFLIHSDSIHLDTALDQFNQLYNDEDCNEFLLKLLKIENNGVDIEVIYDAQDKFISYLIETACGKCIKFWNSGSAVEALNLLKMILVSPFDNDIIDRILRNIIRPFWEKKAQNLESEISEFNRWHIESDITTILENAENLKLFAQVLDGRCSNTGDWLLATQVQLDQIVENGIIKAKDIIRQNADYDAANILLTRLQKLSCSPELHQQIVDELSFQSKCLNKSDHNKNVYNGTLCEVTIATGRILVPQYCCCCLASADKEHKVTRSWSEDMGSYRRDHSVSFDFPICSKCIKHSDQLFNKTILMATLTLVPSTIAAWFIKQEWTNISWLLYTGIGLFISIVIMLIFAKLVKVCKLDPCHATRTDPVISVDAGSGWMRLRFWNIEYARAFAKSNNLNLDITNAKNYNLGPILFAGAARDTIITWVLILMFSISSIIYIIYAGNSNGNNDHLKSVGSKQSIDISQSQKKVRIDRLVLERNRLIAQLESNKSDIDTNKDQLDLDKQELEELGNTIDSEREYVDNADEFSVSEFNEKVDDFNRKRKDYNLQVTEYNHLVNEQRKYIERLEEVESALSE